ncbi:hypothetical protein [Streptomyces sp. TLI_185]|uniref:hypothetical protein n=1 Tax=Streptomyces sp. TLI_185 TaxID=2485151 RepID=UPI000F988182|nr:hypothetical protein [Streptomyces sp. TLI_185]RPF30270.1 hypothetical protein EDD92_0018 [Streptomyces sp. TLI_185]
MTGTLHTPPPAAAGNHERPFTRDPGRWERERSRALRTGHVRDHTCSAACEPVLVHERTPWGWLAWTVPGDGSPPQIPHRIAVLTPGATRTQRLALRWLARRPAQRIASDRAWSLRFSAAAVALVSLVVGLVAMSHQVPVDVALPAMLLAPLLAEHLPERLDSGARAHVHTVEGDDACRYLQRLAALHTSLVHAAAGSDRYELRRSAEIGHNLLWDAASLLQARDTRAVADGLIARERLMLQLAHQVAQIIQRTADEDATADDVQARDLAPLDRHAPSVRPATPRPLTAPSPRKGTLLMPQPESGPADRTPDVYLLFAHEPYYPGPGTQEFNTTVVAADSLLHPQVRQPDGARIHDLLTQGRQPGEIIPLATLTHELGGGADWPTVGDWESVTTDLLQLVRDGDCDALSLGLPEIARALVCTSPHSHVRAYDAAADDVVVYGSSERAAVLDEVGVHLTGIATEQPFWPGDSLLPPLVGRRAGGR